MTLERMTDKRLIGLKCENGHSFDAAKEGYVNLLTSQKGASKEHGDNKLMIDARRAFLEAGYYAPFRDTVGGTVDAYTKNADGMLVDIGCGEGYYTVGLAKRLPTVGIDISKYAVRCAAKRLGAAYPGDILSGRIALVTASANALPVCDGSVSAAVNLFAPLEVPELCRVVMSGGYFVYAVPTPRHLFGLKKVLYDEPYENKEQLCDYEGFEFVERRRCERDVTIERAHIMPLLMMTPYYYRTPEEGVKRLGEVDALETTLGMDFIVYRRK